MKSVMTPVVSAERGGNMKCKKSLILFWRDDDDTVFNHYLINIKPCSVNTEV